MKENDDMGLHLSSEQLNAAGMREHSAANTYYGKVFVAAAKAFDLKTRLVFGSAIDFATRFCSDLGEGERLIFTSDSGYFSAGKGLRSAISATGREALVFCADDGEINPLALRGFFSSAKNPVCAVIIGAEDLYCAVASVCLKSGIPLAFVPHDCEFNSIFYERVQSKNVCGEKTQAEKSYSSSFCEPEFLIIDEDLIEKTSGKHKTYSACCTVEAARAALFDLNAYCELIEKDNDKKSELSKLELVRSHYLKAFDLLNEFYKTRKIAALASACAIVGICYRFNFVANAAGTLARLLKRGGRLENGLRGELELYSAQALFLIYELFLSEKFYNEYFHAFYPPDVFFRTERLKNDYSLSYEQISEALPLYLFDAEKIEGLLITLIRSQKIKSELENFKSGLMLCRENLKGVYGGKRRTVRDYSAKNRASALFSAPLAAEGFCVLKLAYAAGALENIEV